MELNVKNFGEALKKATLNYNIDSVQLKVTGDRVKSKMRSSNNDVVLILDMPNDIISDVPDEIEFNFDDPNVRVKPYINLIDNETVDFRVSDEKMVIRDAGQKIDLFFTVSSFVTTLTSDAPTHEPFYEIDLTDTAMIYFDKIGRIAGKFKTVYFTTRDNKFLIETTSRGDKYSNGMNFDLGEITASNIDIPIEFQNFQAVMQLIAGRHTDFKVKFVWLEDHKSGFVVFENVDASEKYYLMSKIEL